MERRERNHRRIAGAALLGTVAAVGVEGVRGAELIYDATNAPGITTTAGTWDSNSTTRWSTSEAGSDPLLAWSSNSNTAVFIPGSSATVTVSAANGQVGTAGLRFQGAGTGTLTLASTGGATLQVGSGGINGTLTAGVADITAPVVLNGSQTVTASQLRNNNSGVSGPVVRLSGTVSSLSGSTNLTFDGQGLSNAYALANSEQRVIFSMSGINTYSGTTTVTGGASLWLNYTGGSSANTSRLDDTKALVLAGGSISMNGGPSVPEITGGATPVSELVGSTTLAKGANSIVAGPNGGGTSSPNPNRSNLQLGSITRTAGAGGVMDITNAVTQLAYTTTANTNGILGGWATLGGSWATGSADGVTSTAIASTNGSTVNTTTSWNSTTSSSNVNFTASLSALGSKTINALRLSHGVSNLSAGFTSDATVTVNSGGVIAGGATGHAISGGNLTSGLSSGELFVHASSNPVTLSSKVIDNGATPTILVKAGKSNLVLSGANTFTGGTIIDAGTLQLDGTLATADIRLESGSLTGSGTITYNLAGNDADLITIAGGVLDIGGLTLNLHITGSQTASEYVIADRAEVTSYIAGAQFFDVLNKPSDWTIEYNGTTNNPGKIVLVTAVPEPSSVAALGLAGIGLLRRRR